jgi:hypothetical protein
MRLKPISTEYMYLPPQHPLKHRAGTRHTARTINMTRQLLAFFSADTTADETGHSSRMLSHHERNTTHQQHGPHAQGSRALVFKRMPACSCAHSAHAHPSYTRATLRATHAALRLLLLCLRSAQHMSWEVQARITSTEL